METLHYLDLIYSLGYVSPLCIPNISLSYLEFSELTSFLQVLRLSLHWECSCQLFNLNISHLVVSYLHHSALQSLFQEYLIPLASFHLKAPVLISSTCLLCCSLHTHFTLETWYSSLPSVPNISTGTLEYSTYI